MALEQVSITDTPERIAFRSALKSLREDIKIDSKDIPLMKKRLVAAQREGAEDARYDQANLSHVRRRVRANLLLYAFLRGKSWAHVEPQHPEGVTYMRYPLKIHWGKVVTYVKKETGLGSPTTPEIERYAG